MIRLFQAPNTETATVLTLISLAAIFHFRRQVLELLKESFCVAAMVWCFTMLSGYTWNKMLKPAFSVQTDQGPVLITKKQNKQFVAESYIVAVLNATVVIGMILSIEGAGGVRGTEARQREGKRRLQVLAGLALMLASFAVLIAVFRVKRPWYPYGFNGEPGRPPGFTRVTHCYFFLWYCILSMALFAQWHCIR